MKSDQLYYPDLSQNQFLVETKESIKLSVLLHEGGFFYCSRDIVFSQPVEMFKEFITHLSR